MYTHARYILARARARAAAGPAARTHTPDSETLNVPLKCTPIFLLALTLTHSTALPRGLHASLCVYIRVTQLFRTDDKSNFLLFLILV